MLLVRLTLVHSLVGHQSTITGGIWPVNAIAPTSVQLYTAFAAAVGNDYCCQTGVSIHVECIIKFGPISVHSDIVAM